MMGAISPRPFISGKWQCMRAATQNLSDRGKAPVCDNATNPGMTKRKSPSPIEVALMPALPALEIDMNVLFPREPQEFLDAFLAPDAGLLVAAEWRAEEML